MAKPYSQDLRISGDRCGEDGQDEPASCRAPLRGQRNPWPSSGSNGLNARARESLLDMAAIAPPSSCRIGVPRGGAGREVGCHASGSL